MESTPPPPTQTGSITNERVYRLTRPERYAPGSPGARDASSRLGYYVKASSPAAARDKLRARSLEFPVGMHEHLDVQAWSDTRNVGLLVDDNDTPIVQRRQG